MDKSNARPTPEILGPTPFVWLVVDEDAHADALQPTAEILATFHIRAEILDGSLTDLGAGSASGPRAIVVASADAALPGRLASRTEAPVIRVPTPGKGRQALELLDDGSGNLPAGNEGSSFATMAIGEAGAKNAALFVVAMLALEDPRLRAAWADYRARQTESILSQPPPSLAE